MAEAHKLTEAQAKWLAMADEGGYLPTINPDTADRTRRACERKGLASERFMCWWEITDAGRAALARHRGETP